ncbi:MAG TPA: putative Ig domain-containing protein [Candidatus Woesearchaeota archaeon]|nr:putative Ig domain-containing protein [Candidatus Woesearchaeota archaeon]
MKKTLLVMLTVLGILLMSQSVLAALMITPITDKIINEGEELALVVTYAGNVSAVTLGIETNATGAVFNAATGEFKWTPAFNQAGTYTVTITANDGTTIDTKDFQITVMDVNRDPVFKSTPVKSMYVEEIYTYNAIAEDPDGDEIAYVLIQGPAGMVMNSTDSKGILKWTAPNLSGTHLVKISASDGKGGVAYQEFNLSVRERPSRIEVTKIYANTPDDSRIDLLGGSTFRVKPGDDVTVYVEVKNFYNDGVNLEDVYFNLLIPSLLDEGDDDFDEESDEIDIRPVKTGRMSISFQVPTRIEAEVYDLFITIKGYDEEGAYYEEDYFFDMTVRKDSYAISLTRSDVSPQTIFCNQDALIYIDALIENMGRNRIDDLVFKVTSSELGINYQKSDIELTNDPYDTKSRYAVSTSVPVRATKEGIHNVVLETYSAGRKEVSQSKTFQIRVLCDITPTPTPTTPVTPTPTPTTPVTPTPTPTVVREKPFTETNLFLGILIAAVVLLGIMVILMLSLLFRK